MYKVRSLYIFFGVIEIHSGYLSNSARGEQIDSAYTYSDLIGDTDWVRSACATLSSKVPLPKFFYTLPSWNPGKMYLESS